MSGNDRTPFGRSNSGSVYIEQKQEAGSTANNTNENTQLLHQSASSYDSSKNRKVNYNNNNNNSSNNNTIMMSDSSGRYQSVSTTLEEDTDDDHHHHEVNGYVQLPPTVQPSSSSSSSLIRHSNGQYRPASIVMHRTGAPDQLQYLLENDEIPTVTNVNNNNNNNNDFPVLVHNEQNDDDSNDTSFIHDFLQSNGPPQIVLLICILAIGFGSIIGVVPAVMTDRYARNHYGYDGIADCASVNNPKPIECIEGSADAQNAAAVENLVSNILTFATSSLLGSISDMYGRRNILIVSMIVCTIRPIVLVAIQTYPSMNPGWYYAASALNGLFNWIAIALSSMSDVMPSKWRAPSFGLLIAGFLLGIAVAPQLAILLGHYNVSILSLGMVCIGLLLTIFFLPETLSIESSTIAKQQYNERVQHLTTSWDKITWYIYRPLYEITILNRNRLFRLLTTLAFFSSFVSAGDQTLVIYYIQERIGFTDADVANFFMLVGLLGIFMQGVVLKHANTIFGERMLLILCFLIASIHNAWYGISHTKSSIFMAASIGTIGAMAFPTISAVKANNVESSEQGRIQGALYSVSAVASAIGPIGMRFVYHYTKDGIWFGPGSMFIVAAIVNCFAVYCAYLLPDEANSQKRNVSPSNMTSVFPVVDGTDEETTALDTTSTHVSESSSPLL